MRVCSTLVVGHSSIPQGYKKKERPPSRSFTLIVTDQQQQHIKPPAPHPLVFTFYSPFTHLLITFCSPSSPLPANSMSTPQHLRHTSNPSPTRLPTRHNTPLPSTNKNNANKPHRNINRRVSNSIFVGTVTTTKSQA